MIDLILGIRTPRLVEELLILEIVSPYNQDHDCICVASRGAEPQDTLPRKIVSYMRQRRELFVSKRVHNERFECLVGFILGAPAPFVDKDLPLAIWLDKCAQLVFHDLSSMGDLLRIVV